MILMVLGMVSGNLWATKKDESLNGYKLMIVQLISSKNEPLGEEIVAVDTVGAGIGEIVIIARGSSSRVQNGDFVKSPVDASIVGIVDGIE